MSSISSQNRLLVISGPSCAGKSPLCAAARVARPELFENTRELVLYHSRAPRPHEQEGRDYYFRHREWIDELRAEPGFVVWKIRDELQALELRRFDDVLQRGSALYEGNFRIALDLQRRSPQPCLSVFVSPLSRAEVKAWRHASDESFVKQLTELMRRRLLRRAHATHAHLGLSDLRAIEIRAADAIESLRHAHLFDFVLPNHDGEDSDHWDLGQSPIGDARLSVEALCAALEDHPHPRLETWPDELVPTR